MRNIHPFHPLAVAGRVVYVGLGIVLALLLMDKDGVPEITPVRPIIMERNKIVMVDRVVRVNDRPRAAIPLNFKNPETGYVYRIEMVKDGKVVQEFSMSRVSLHATQLVLQDGQGNDIPLIGDIRIVRRPK